MLSFIELPIFLIEFIIFIILSSSLLTIPLDNIVSSNDLISLNKLSEYSINKFEY